MTVKAMNLAWIVVNDLKEAIKFYTETVGLKLVEHHEQYGWAELTGHETGGARLGISQKNDMEPIKPGNNAILTLTVENLDKSMKELSKNKVKFVGGVMEIPGQVKLQLCVDKDGNHFQMVEILRGN